MSDVAHVGHVPEIEAGTEDVGCLVLSDAGVDGRDELDVAGAGEDGGTEDAGGEGWGVVSGEDDMFGLGLDEMEMR